MFNRYMPFYSDTDESGGGTAQQTDVQKPVETQASETATQQQQPSVDFSKINPEDLPFDLVKKHPKYIEVMDETVGRRQQIKTLREQLDAIEGVKPKVEPKQEQPKDTSALDAETLALLKEIKQERAQAAQRKAIEPLAVKHNVPEEYRDLIKGDTEAEREAAAIKLGALALKSGTSTGNTGTQGGDSAATSRLIERLKGDADPLKAKSPFDTGIQRQKGGGTNI
jgi:hypothetical protein